MTRLAGIRRTAAWVIREPVIGVLVCAAVVDMLSGSPLSHGSLLLAVALALVVDAARHRRAELHLAPGGAGGEATRPEEAAVRLGPTLILGSLAFSVIVGGFARYSWPATVAVFPVALAFVLVAWGRTAVARVGRSKIDVGGALVWATALVVLGLFELVNLLLQPTLAVGSQAHPTISVLMDPILTSHAGRSIALGAWLVFGWFLLER